jgi:hypothetical protein
LYSILFQVEIRTDVHFSQHSCGVVGIKFDGAVIIGERPLILSHGRVTIPLVEVVCGMVRVEFDAIVIIGERLLMLPQGCVTIPLSTTVVEV